MKNTVESTGKCLCGSVKIKANKVSTDLGACHCNMCRKWSAGPFFAVDCGTDVEITGEENITVFTSSDWAERAFCKKCGASLFYRLKETQQHMLSSELFEGLDLNFDHEIFVDEQPKHYAFSNETKRMTGAEVFASFGGEAE